MLLLVVLVFLPVSSVLVSQLSNYRSKTRTVLGKRGRCGESWKREEKCTRSTDVREDARREILEEVLVSGVSKGVVEKQKQKKRGTKPRVSRGDLVMGKIEE